MKHLHVSFLVAAGLALSACSGSNGTPAETTPQPQVPVVTLASSASSADVGQSVTLTWSAINANSCVASGGWSGSKALTGSENVTVNAGANSFTLTCMGDAGDDSATVTVTGTTPTPPPVPTVTLSSNTPTAAVDKKATLTWSSTNATGCAASGDWSGSKAVSGSGDVDVIHRGPNSFTLTCTGAGGSAAKTLNIIGVSKYDLAGGCYAVKSLANGKFVNAQLTAAADAAADAEPFRMQAAGLARYVFYTHDGKFLTGTAALPGAGGQVTADAAPSNGSDWTFDVTDVGHFVASIKQPLDPVATTNLATDSAGKLITSTTPTTPGEFEFVPATGCAEYPEMPVDVSDTFVGPQTGPLVGFADIHTHMAMGSDMSDGSGDRGPSAGGVMYGHAVDRFGVTEALKDCSVMHGPNGINDPEPTILDLDTNAPQNNVQRQLNGYDTQGWPTFVDWPKRDSQLHQQVYYRWLERTYRAGLRLLVLHGTNIEALCDVAKKTSGADKDKTDCTDMGVGLKQVAYAHDIEAYIDAQHGGPGKGWFRIVKDPTEAEAVIRSGKLAVVPGLEFSNIFHCNVTFGPGGEEGVGCDKATIDAGIEEAWNAGVRGIFLYHDVDSALGGTGIFQAAALNLVNFYGTKHFWDTYTCDDDWGQPKDQGYFYGAGSVLTGHEFGQFNDPISAFLIENAGGQYPAYPPGNQCNKRGITELGKYALQAAMKKGFMLDIDHAEISIKQAMLDEGAKTTPAYPMLSAHGGHGGITNAQALQILKQGGVIYPGMVNGREYKGFVDKERAIWNQMSDAEKAKYPLAVGYGADQNGLANQPGPRGGSGVTPVDYGTGITLFDPANPVWADLASIPGVRPVQVSKLQIDKNKYGANAQGWDVDVDGVAHYGMIADVVGQIALESGTSKDYLDTFYRSADAYVRVWKQARAASAVRPEPTIDLSKVPPMIPQPLDPTTGDPTEPPYYLPSP